MQILRVERSGFHGTVWHAIHAPQYYNIGMLCRGAESSEREDVYDWVREYDYRVRPPDEHEHSYWLGFTESAVTYGRIYNRISTQRNSKIKATPGYARPSEVGPRDWAFALAFLHE